MRSTLPLQCCLLILSLAKSLGAGVLVYKQHSFHSDSLAKAITYDSIESDGVVTWATVGGNRLRFEKTQFHTWTELPKSLPARIATDSEVDELALQLNQLENFSKRFSNAAPLTKATLEMFREAANQLRSGKVRYESNWITRDEYENILAETSAATAARIAKEREEKAALEKRKQLMIEAEEERRLAEIQRERQEREARRQARISKLKSKITDIRTEINDIESNIISLGHRMSELAAENDE